MKRQLEIILGSATGLTYNKNQLSYYNNVKTGNLIPVLQSYLIPAPGGTLDLYENEVYSLNYAISDIRNYAERNSNFSKTIHLPGTANNNKLLGHIFEIGAKGSFNPNKKVPVQVLSDTMPVFEGNFQLAKINPNPVSYECVLYGDTDNFVQNLGDAKFADLNFSGMTHRIDYAHTTASWTNWRTLGYYYPLIDYGKGWSIADMKGQYNNGGGVSIDDLHPGLRVKTAWDMIFSAAGYTYQSNFLNSEWFGNLLIPCPFSDPKHTSDFIDDNTFKIGFSADTTYNSIFNAVWIPGYAALSGPEFSDASSPGYSNANGAYNTSTFVYTVANVVGMMKFGMQINGISTGTTLQAHFYKNNNFSNGQVPKIIYSAPSNPSQYINSFTSLVEFESWVVPGDQIYIKLLAYSAVNPPLDGIRILKQDSFIYNKVNPTIYQGSIPYFGSFVNQDVKQADFFKSIVKAFNLYIEPSKDVPNRLRIEPRDDYYDSGGGKDWSSKIDISSPITEVLLGDLTNKTTNLTYKQDKDYLNEKYFSERERVFGDYKFTVDNDFVVGERKIELIFSPTQSTFVANTTQFIIPQIAKLGTNNSLQPTDMNIRMVQIFSGGTIKNASSDSWVLQGVAQTSYPYVGMVDAPFSGATSINFGVPDGYYYTGVSGETNNNLFYNYWQNTLLEASDVDSRLITCRAFLTPADIATLDFRNKIYIDHIDSHGHYFRLNKISDYDPSKDGLCTVELIKIREGISVIQPRKLTVFSGITIGGIVPKWSPGHPIVIYPVVIGGGGLNTSVPFTGMSNVGRWNVVSHPDNIISDQSEGNSVNGRSNIISNFSENNAIFGSANTINSLAKSNITAGDGNYVSDYASYDFVQGSGNTISTGVTNSQIFGNNLTAFSSNTAYFGGSIIASNNLTVSGSSFFNIASATTLSAGTFYSGTTPLSQIIQTMISSFSGSSSNIWAEGTGLQSVVLFLTGTTANNAVGSRSFVSGFANTVNVAGISGSILGGRNNLVG